MSIATVTAPVLLEYCKDLRKSLGASRCQNPKWFFDNAELAESAAQELQETARDLIEAGNSLLQEKLPMQ